MVRHPKAYRLTYHNCYKSRNEKYSICTFIFFGIPNFGIGIPISRFFNSGIWLNFLWPESSESETDLEFRFWWGSRKSEPKIGIPNQGSLSCGKSSSIFNTKSFTPCLWFVGIWASNFNKTNQFSKDSIESHSGDATLSWLKQNTQRFILQQQVLFNISVGCCIYQLVIKSLFKQTIQNLTSWRNQKQNAIHLSVNCWIQANASDKTAASSGRRLVSKCHFRAWAQLTWVKLRFPIGNVFQVSQITWDKLHFPIGSACQVSQIPSFVHCLWNVGMLIHCFNNHNQSRLECRQSSVSNLHQHQSRLKLYPIFKLDSLANERDVRCLPNGGKWARIYHQSKFICSSTSTVH